VKLIEAEIINEKSEYNAERIVILGSTGSIGQSAVDVLRDMPGKFTVAGLAAGRATDTLLEQIQEFQPSSVAVRDREACERILKSGIEKKVSGRFEVVYGPEGLDRLATMPLAGKVLNAVCGGVGIRPSLSAVRAGKTLLLANKEALVAGGMLITGAAKEFNARILPVDSEHSAIFQCLQGESQRSVRKLIITASGGPFFNVKNTESITPAMALKHPKWNMGPKVTVDSATLMNKGLEIIEAMWLFGIPLDKIQVLIHPECTIHSMVEFTDSVTIAQLSVPDMKLPIRYALNYPRRVCSESVKALNFAEIGKLTFHDLDFKRFPCLEIAVESARIGGLLPAVLSAADEIAVDAFIRGKIAFPAIPKVVEHAVVWGRKNLAGETVSLESITEADKNARALALEAVEKFESPGKSRIIDI
jgi:1-deoxy-D-xylulose-5-phosphate reductoisomerase